MFSFVALAYSGLALWIMSAEASETKPATQAADSLPTTLTLRQLFETDFSDMLKGRNEHNFTDKRTGQKIVITKQLYLDHACRYTFVGFFIPSLGPTSHETRDICEYLSSNYKLAFELEREVLSGGHIGEDATETTELTFTGRVYIYHQDSLTTEDRAALIKSFREHGAAVTFRGQDYLAMSILARQAAKPSSRVP
jgi:hypothetical protein